MRAESSFFIYFGDPKAVAEDNPEVCSNEDSFYKRYDLYMYFCAENCFRQNLSSRSKDQPEQTTLLKYVFLMKCLVYFHIHLVKSCKFENTNCKIQYNICMDK